MFISEESFIQINLHAENVTAEKDPNTFHVYSSEWAEEALVQLITQNYPAFFKIKLLKS